MDTEINSIDKSLSDDNITLDKILNEEIIINNLSEISSNDQINNNQYEINIDNISNNDEINIDQLSGISQNDIINDLPEINLNEIIENGNEHINHLYSNNKLSAETNDECVLDENVYQIDSDKILNNFSIDVGYNTINDISVNNDKLQEEVNNQDKQEDDISLDINDRISHTHGFIEQQLFDNKLNIDSEFYISRDLTLAHNLDFTDSSLELTKVQNFSNDILNMSIDNTATINNKPDFNISSDNIVDLEKIDLNLVNFDNAIVNNLSNIDQFPDINKYYENQIIEGTQFINGTIENSYILGSTLSNVIFEGKISNINKTDYINSPLNGKISCVTAGVDIESYQCVECYINNGKLLVRPTNPTTKSPFLGIAQNSVLEGGIVEVLTEGITYLNVKNIIELPILKRVGNQIIFASDNKNNIFTQNITMNIEKNDILVLTGSSNDILIGPSTKYFQFNRLNTVGSLTLYKSIQINFQSGSYLLNNSHLLLHQSKKMFKNNQFITVLDIEENGKIIGLLN